MRGRILWLVALAAASSLHCVCGAEVGSRNSTVPESCRTQPALIVPQKTDILFVIDNSGSMIEEQTEVANELPAFVAELAQGGGITNDFQVGVVTTSIYQHTISPPPVGEVIRTFPTQGGKLRPAAMIDGGTARYLRGDDPDVVAEFALLVKQGTFGSGQETPFEAVRLATMPPNTDAENAGFFRDGARLVVVVVSDEDDCSEHVTFQADGGVQPPPRVVVSTSVSEDFCTRDSAFLATVDDYYGIYTSLTDGNGRKRDVIWTAIAPVGRTDKTAQQITDNGVIRNVDCPTSSGPGYRERAMALKFNQQLTNLDSICNPSYHDTLVNIADIANITTSVAVTGIPDPGLLTVEITRAGGALDRCTVDNGGIRYEPATDAEDARIFFLGNCPRLPGDAKIELKLLCAG